MKATTKFLGLTMIILMICLGCACAADMSDTQTDTTTRITDSQNNMEDIQAVKTIKESSDITVPDNSKKNNKTIKQTKDIKKASEYEIREADYALYFRLNDKLGRVETTDLVRAGDTINLKGNFAGKNFTLDKPNLTLSSINKSAMLKNCSVIVCGANSANSTVSNLKINNSNPNGIGIFVYDTTNITIYDNTVYCKGIDAFGLDTFNMTHSLILKNKIETDRRDDTDRTHTAMAFGSSHYNRIENNTVKSLNANGIYLCSFTTPSGSFIGGPCDYNNITGNKVSGGDTSWCYTIQVMGSYNIIDRNYVNGGYRGISTQDFADNLIINNEINGTHEGIFAYKDTVIRNNKVHVNGTTTGVVIGGPGVLVEENDIASNSGNCIDIRGSNVVIKNNEILSTLGNCIYSKGDFKNITLTNNNMTAHKAGVVFRKQSSLLRINNVTVTRNRIQSYGAVAIDFSDAGAVNPADSKIVVDESNTLNCSQGMGLDKAYYPPSAGTGGAGTPDSNKTYVVTDSNYVLYFYDDDSTLNTKKVLKNDTIILQGEFRNKNFIFPQKTHVIGRNCTIYNGTIQFTSDASSSTLRNVTIKNNDPKSNNRHGVELFTINNCILTNNTIYNYDLWESFGIWLHSSSGNTITDNNIITSGDYVNYAIIIDSSDLNIIKNNRIYVNQSGKPQPYADEIMLNYAIGTIPEILHNYGIIALYSSYNTIENNDVTTRSEFKEYCTPTEDCKNSIVGIDLYYNSNYNIVLNNKVDVESFGPYSYGIGVLGGSWGTSVNSFNATNNSFIKNDVTVKGGYFATGFIAGLNSVNTKVEDNIINVYARNNNTHKGDYAYGITFEKSFKTTVNDNIINCEGAAVYSVEIFDSFENKIYKNNFNSTGTYVYGIAGENADNNIITQNNFKLVNGSYGSIIKAGHSDSIPYGNTGIYFKANCVGNNITLNTINTTAFTTVNMTGNVVNNTVMENSLQSSRNIGDKSVENNHKTNIVKRNFLHFTTINISPMQATVGKPFTINGKITATTGDLTNLTVNLRVGITDLGTVKVAKDGTFTLKVNETSFFKPTTYTINGIVSGENFQNSTTEVSLNLNKTLTQSKVIVTKVKTLPGMNATLIVDVTDSFGSKLSGEVILRLDNEILTTQNLTLGRLAYKYRVPLNTKTGIYNITAVYKGNKEYTASEGTNTLSVQTESIVTVKDVTATILDDVTLSATITSNGKAVNGGTVTIRVNGADVIKKLEVKNGKISYRYKVPADFKNKKYNIKVLYSGNDLVASSTGNNNLTVELKTGQINYNKTYTTVGQQTTLVITISDKDKQAYAKTGNMTLAINGQTLKNPDKTVVTGNVEENKVIFLFKAPATLEGKNNITFHYHGDSQFKAVNQTFTNGLEISKDGLSKITLDKVTGTYGTNTTFTVKVTDKNGKKLSSGTAIFKLNGNTLRQNGKDLKVNIVNGEAKMTYFIKNSAKNYRLTAVVSQGATRLEKNSTMTVTKAAKTIQLDGILTTGKTATITGKIVDTRNNPVSTDTKVTVKINGKTVKSGVKVANGTINIKIDTSKYSNKAYNVTVIGGESNTYKTATNQTLLMKNIKNQIVVMPQTAKQNTTVTLTAFIIDKNGKFVEDAQVAFKLDGKTLQKDKKPVKVTTTNGKAAINYQLTGISIKNHKLTAVSTVSKTRYENTAILKVTK